MVSSVSRTGPRIFTWALPKEKLSPASGMVISVPCFSSPSRKFLKALLSYSVTGARAVSTDAYVRAPERPPTWSSWAWVQTI